MAEQAGSHIYHNERLWQRPLPASAPPPYNPRQIRCTGFAGTKQRKNGARCSTSVVQAAGVSLMREMNQVRSMFLCAGSSCSPAEAWDDVIASSPIG